MIRLANAADAAGVARIYGPVAATTAISFEIVAPSAEEMSGRIATVLASLPWRARVLSEAEA